MKKTLLLILVPIFLFSCQTQETGKSSKSAAEILGNPEYLAFSFGGYREKTRDIVPTVEQLKEDMQILSALGVKLIRTYNTKLKQLPNLLRAIEELKMENPDFEMYVMVGAWIDSQYAWTDSVNHEAEEEERNAGEIERAIDAAKQYPDIVKIIAVGNEAMVHWAATYFVRPKVILKWVTFLQEKKNRGELPSDLWITSSDNYVSWGGGEAVYHTDDLNELIKAVDYVSLHTYPFHESHYQPEFWQVPENEKELSKSEQIEMAMERAMQRAKDQYNNTAKYIKGLGIEKPVHIGETGWATTDNHLYGNEGSKAADEFKQKIFYDKMREWTNKEGISCFFFEIFDEQWKDEKNAMGSENHFGLLNLKGEAKYTLWQQVDNGVFKGITRGGKAITKTYRGNEEALLEQVLVPPFKNQN